MSKHRSDLIKVSSNRQQPKLILWHNLSEDEQTTISGGISPMLPLDLIRGHRNKSLSPGELDRI